MTREAILGMENGGGVQRRTFAALPFTRFVTGPADFTPTVFSAGPMGTSTAGSQLAIAFAYASPIHHWGDSAKAYSALAPEVLHFIRNKPAVWDETKVLPGSRIGEVALMARRSGKIWYVASINGTDQDMTPEITTSFLAAGKWDAVSFSHAVLLEVGFFGLRRPEHRQWCGGRPHVNGVLSMARMGPDTGKASFSIVIGDQAEMDFGGRRNPDGQGFAVFGRVVDGWDVVKKIHQAHTGRSGPYQTETLEPPIKILKAYRKE